MTGSTDPTRTPVVFARDGEVFASSRDVAAFFEKRHDHVLRDIGALIAACPTLAHRQFDGEPRSLKSEETRVPKFGETVVERPNPSGGAPIQSRVVEMTRDGFTLLCMGFTGAKALRWKLRYIEAFNAMEAELRKRQTDYTEALSDPAMLRTLLGNYAEKVISLEGKVEEMRPQVQALERIASSDGSLCITDAAKTLQVRPKELFTFLRAHHWIYSRGGGGEVAYQSKLAVGLLEHKTTTVQRSDGSEKTVTQVRVTPKGLTRLAQEFPSQFKEAG